LCRLSETTLPGNLACGASKIVDISTELLLSGRPRHVCQRVRVAKGQKNQPPMMMMIIAFTCQQKRKNTEKRDGLPRTPVNSYCCKSAWVRRYVRHESACTANVQAEKLTRTEETERALDTAGRAVRFKGVPRGINRGPRHRMGSSIRLIRVALMIYIYLCHSGEQRPTTPVVVVARDTSGSGGQGFDQLL
jgi:hypothetical protein